MTLLYVDNIYLGLESNLRAISKVCKETCSLQKRSLKTTHVTDYFSHIYLPDIISWENVTIYSRFLKCHYPLKGIDFGIHQEVCLKVGLTVSHMGVPDLFKQYCSLHILRISKILVTENHNAERKALYTDIIEVISYCLSHVS